MVSVHELGGNNKDRQLEFLRLEESALDAVIAERRKQYEAGEITQQQLIQSEEKYEKEKRAIARRRKKLRPSMH